MLRSSALAAALLLLPGLALAQAKGQPDRNADWLVKPDSEMIASHYPPFALWLEVTGRVVLSCKVTTEGRLFQCTARDETPRSLGFGKAAIEASASMLMQPKIRGGQPVEGTVTIPITFSLPEDEADKKEEKADAKPAAKPTPKAEELAMGLALEQAQVIEAYTAFEAMADGLAADLPDKKIREAAADAMREAASDALIDFRNGWAKIYTDTFTEAELAEIVTFYQSPIGKTLAKKQGQFYASLQALQLGVMVKMRDGTRERLCAQLGCLPAKASPPPSPK